jgi:5-methylcytosine-specific restriction endonuclease McrA
MKKIQNKEETPKYMIVRNLRLLWMRSRERAATLKRDSYTCQQCNIKQSTAKGKEVSVQVHHKENEIDWDDLVKIIREKLLQDKDKLETLCLECHLKHHSKEDK